MKTCLNYLLGRGVAGILFGSMLVVTGRADSKLAIQMVPMLQLSGEGGVTNQIQYTTDLNQTNQWLVLTNVVLGNNVFVFFDAAATGSVKRFYRTVVLNAPTNNTPSVDTNLWAWIPPGTFVMGSTNTESERSDVESPQTRVTISKGFWMSKYLVTQKLYQALVGINYSQFTNDLQRPVEWVSWFDATNYCGLLTVQERKAGRLPLGYSYRLPTEAEWEYACRAGTTTRFSYGNDPTDSQLINYAWYISNSTNTTHAVGQKLPNPWGLFDIMGNVMEWCADWWGDRLPGGSVTDPTGPVSGIYRVYRGGACDSIASQCRSAARDKTWPTVKSGNIGFRAVLAAD